MLEIATTCGTIIIRVQCIVNTFEAIKTGVKAGVCFSFVSTYDVYSAKHVIIVLGLNCYAIELYSSKTL